MIVSDFNTMTCGSCSFNDGVCYTSYPPKYRCTFDNGYYEGFHPCHFELMPVRHGQWETKEYTTEDSFDDWIVIHHEEVCSECGKGQGERSKFCPNCGAKMDGGAE